VYFGFDFPAQIFSYVLSLLLAIFRIVVELDLCQLYLAKAMGAFLEDAE